MHHFFRRKNLWKRRGDLWSVFMIQKEVAQAVKEGLPAPPTPPTVSTHPIAAMIHPPSCFNMLDIVIRKANPKGQRFSIRYNRKQARDSFKTSLNCTLIACLVSHLYIFASYFSWARKPLNHSPLKDFVIWIILISSSFVHKGVWILFNESNAFKFEYDWS